MKGGLIMSNKTPPNTSLNKKVTLSFNEEELNTIMGDLKEAPYMRTPGCFGGTPKTFIILKDKIQKEIDRRKELLKSFEEDNK
jgi:hypothetical protein